MNMAILTKRAVLCSGLKFASPNACIQPTTAAAADFSNITSVNCFSTAAYQRAHQGKEIDESKDMSGVKGFVADTAMQGTVKATEMGEKVGEMAKEGMDTAWDSAKNTSQKLQDTLVSEADENVVDTTEYRTIEDLSHLNDIDHGYEHHDDPHHVKF